MFSRQRADIAYHGSPAIRCNYSFKNNCGNSSKYATGSGNLVVWCVTTIPSEVYER
jgi:hypothetical protein